MKPIFTFLLSLFIISTVAASGEWINQGGRSAGMGHSSVAICDFWSINNNQAGMAFYDKSAAGLYYENRYLIKEMASQNGAVMLKMKSGVIGATLGYSGDANYNTTKVGLAYALKLGNRFAAGIQLDYIGTKLGEEYGKRSNITFDAGIMVKISDQLTFGAHTFNPIHVKFSDYNSETIPIVFNTGFGYTFSDKLLLTAEAFKNSEYPLEFRSGAEYKIASIAFARIGVSTNPARYTFGFGLEMKNLTVDLSSSYHAQLGYSPQFSVHFAF